MTFKEMNIDAYCLNLEKRIRTKFGYLQNMHKTEFVSEGFPKCI